MAAAVTMLAKERGGPPISFQVLFYPVTDANFDTPSYVAYQNDYWLTREDMKWFWDNYASNQTNRKEPTVSPLHASIEQLKGLPPALVITGEFDVLLDEGEAYAHKLIEAGVPVTGVRFHGTIRDNQRSLFRQLTMSPEIWSYVNINTGNSIYNIYTNK
jgi:acetyl esterase